MKKISLRLALLAGATLLPGLAYATPSLDLRAYDVTGGGSTPISFIKTAPSGSPGNVTGLLTAPTSDFTSIILSANGADLSNGGLSTTTVSASGVAGAVLLLQVTQTGLVAGASTQPFNMTFTLNTLTGSPSGASAVYTDYVSAGNVSYGGSTLASPVTLSAVMSTAQSSSTALATGLAPGSLYSETQFVTITFNGTGSVTASSQLVPVPEPATLTVLGGALVGFGALRRRRQKTA